MSKIKHNEAISIFQMVLTFLQQVLGLCKKRPEQSSDETPQSGYVNETR